MDEQWEEGGAKKIYYYFFSVGVYRMKKTASVREKVDSRGEVRLSEGDGKHGGLVSGL